ncbi:MAG: TerB family tellurite resistance protein [Pirellulales bacterium]
MILIGSFNWPSTVSRGEFFCPNCGNVAPYAHKQSRTFLTLYFIPILPISGLQDYVECGLCRQNFYPEVLQQTSAPAEDGSAPGPVDFDFDLELLRAMALIMVEDGRVTPFEEQVASRVFEGITQQPLDKDKLQYTCRQAELLPLSTHEYLTTVSDKLSYDQKLLLVQAMFAIAGADGEISPGRMATLLQSREILGLEPAAFQQAVGDASQWLG